VFAHSVEDAVRVDDAVRGLDGSDAFSREVARQPASAPRVAMPEADDIETFGDEQVRALYASAHTHALSVFPGLAPADLGPFQAINDHMFFGPFLSERDVSVGAFIDAQSAQCHEVVRTLIQNSRKFTAADAYRALYDVEEARRATAPFWDAYDVLITPTVGALVTLEMIEADPLGPNFRNGHYTNFANPLGLAAIAAPMGRSQYNVPWGVTLYAPPERFQTLAQAAELLMSGGR
jgi:allophanate hydrolase/aspartyl-tRNA(Asn)/glutamyl-tRNA(Gln) amidotransferase subunit A